ncbi:hypothetical protein [Asanoa sp. NPDC050611]|uniref:hypothetical protein n=1 Tax=Asanoa sp. NPDC050611 TaxID=3157098 RepID=UPI00340DA146
MAWFSERPLHADAVAARRERFAAASSAIVPDSYERLELGGPDWGVTVLHPVDQGAFRWPVVATEGPLTAVSLGLPVGLDLTGGPIALARRLLAGEDPHRDVIPPFGLIGIETAAGGGGQRVDIAQDWLGMCRLFTGEADGITAFCTRPSPLAAFLHGTVEPDLDGWAAYVASGQFGGDLSPVRGTRMLRPGERATARPLTAGGWEVTSARGHSIDDVVLAGFAARQRPLAETFDAAAEALTSSATSLHDLYDSQIVLGLSGGKDSRLLAATLIAAGRLPRLVTNDDTLAEGQTAGRLVQLLRDKRGVDPEHRIQAAGAPADVLGVGLGERTRRLQRQYDYQFPSTYLVRPARPGRLPERPHGANFTGAAGELATGAWYPPETSDVPVPEVVLTRLVSALARGVAPEADAAERRRVTALVAHAEEVGLHGLHLIDYCYLVERARRKATSAYAIGLVTPFLSPGFVAASFALASAQKRAQVLHKGLIARLVPEWSEVPFVSVSTGASTATRVWQGDGIEVMADLLDTAHGPLTELIRRDAVLTALTKAAGGGQPDARTLQQFTYLAVASEQLEPGTTRPRTSATYAAVTAPRPQQPAGWRPHPRLVARLRWVKKTRLGNRIWATVRNRVRRPRS